MPVQEGAGILVVPLHAKTDALGLLTSASPSRALRHIWNPQISQPQVCARPHSQAAFLGGSRESILEEGAGNLSHVLQGGREGGAAELWEPELGVPRVSLACPGLPSLEGNVFVYAGLPDFLCFLAPGHSSHASLSVFINTNFFLSPHSAGEFLSGFYVPARLCVNSQQCYQ